MIGCLVLPNKRSQRLTNEIKAELAIGHSKHLEDMNQHPAEYICFRNGVYDPVRKKMLPHDPDYLFMNQIPWDFDPEAPMPEGENIEKFFFDIGLSPENRRMMLSFFGLCLTTDTRLQKFLVFKGVPNTGKSVMLSLVEATVGRQNISSIALEEIANEPFHAFGLIGKLCNICADLQADGVLDPTRIKKLIGEDIIQVQRKYHDPFGVRAYTRCLFAMNGYPVILAKDEAFYRRVMILPMNIVPESVDIHLLERLKTEIPYLIRICVSTLEEYYQLSDPRSIESQESRLLVNAWKIRGDSISAFLIDGDAFGEEASVKKSTLFQRYKEYCVDEGRTPVGKQNFKEALVSKGVPLRSLHGEDVFDNPHFDDRFRDAGETPFDEVGHE
jgi:P4 family phage/plasmid primase-like protien